MYIDRFSEHGHFSDDSDLRYRGFCEAMRELGLGDDVTQRTLTRCRNPAEVAAKLEDYLQQQPVDAIFGRNDKLAGIAMQKVQQLGYRVPEDIAVIGFDNSTLSQYMTPPLTTVEIPREQIARAAVEMLQQMINRHEVPQPVSFDTQMIERASTP